EEYVILDSFESEWSSVVCSYYLFGATAAASAGALLQLPLDLGFRNLFLLHVLLVLDGVASLLPAALSRLDRALRLLAFLVPVLHALSLLVRHELSKSL
ncbi:hypothetical protein ABZV15_35760, partial [Streptomyces sp. NPDC005246]|uniref:hypothetical protein n=1 Tax=Streptomyces sp. NPDC005246 TaxID=3156716 RepID=UPI0033B395B3